MMNEIKSSMQAIQERGTIGDLLELNGGMRDLNNNKDVVFTLIPEPKKERTNYAEDLIEELER